MQVVKKKDSPNLNRTFYVCAYPEGPKNDPKATCNYFKVRSLPTAAPSVLRSATGAA